MTTSTFLPRNADRWTGRPARSGTAKSGAMRELDEPTAERLHFTEAPHALTGFGHDRLAGLLRKRGEVEVVPADHVLRDRDTQVGAARALRLQLELVDPRQIALPYPQCIRCLLRIASDAVQCHGSIVVQHGRGR